MRVCSSCRLLLSADANMCPADGATADVVETLPKDTRLGAYKIDRVLGEGGMGFVYEATHEVLKRRSAIKMLRPELAKLEQIVTRFLNEAKAVNLIDHQNIVNVYDYGDGLDGTVYFVMEYLEGETLDDLMRRRRQMPLPLLLHVFGQIAKALGAAHAKKIVHRDLKPGNVFVVPREDNPYFIKLLDFGIAQLRGEGAVQGLTLAGTVMGTPQYMSPEQISGGAVDARSDVWALGVMLYRAATGQAPFKGEEFAELADKIFHHAPQPAEQIVPMPATLAKLIASCLERDVDARCQSVADFIAGLERVRRESGLDDDAILAAMSADAEATGVRSPASARAPTPESLPGSVPWYRNVPGAAAPPKPAPRRQSRLGLYATIAAIAGGLGVAAFVVLDRSEVSGMVQPPAPTKPAPLEEVAACGGERPAIAEQRLRAAIVSGTLQEQGFAVDALAMTRVPAGAPLLHVALKAQSPDVRVKAARALGHLALPASAPKVRTALSDAGVLLKVELAAVLYRLGDKDAREILQRATQDLGPGIRLTAALAMAEAGDDGARAALADILEASPAGSEPWRRAAGGLLKLGDANARALLEGELAQSDELRAVGAAQLLARTGDANAREQLASNAADPDFARSGDAAVALARLGDKRALAWAGRNLGSSDPEACKLALAILGALTADAMPRCEAIAKVAKDDPDLSVRMTAEAVLLGL